jgi:hypothetical protein
MRSYSSGTFNAALAAAASNPPIARVFSPHCKTKGASRHHSGNASQIALSAASYALNARLQHDQHALHGLD